jgi:hypothetical protein
MPWHGAQQRAIAAQKFREAKGKGMSDKAAREYVRRFFHAHGQGANNALVDAHRKQKGKG